MPYWGADIKGSFSLGRFYDNYNAGKFNSEQSEKLATVVQEFVRNL